MTFWGRMAGRFLVVLFLSALWYGATAATAQADAVVGDGTPASCDGNALAAGIAQGGLVTFNCGGAATIVANTNVITQPVTLAGAGLITIDGENLRQLFLVLAQGRLTLLDITLSKGNFVNGGCIDLLTGGEATLRNVVVDGCVAETVNGGAIRAGMGAILTVEFGRFQNNRAKVTGGAIYNNGGTVVVRDSIFSSNRADSNGGAISQLGGSLTVERTLFTGNQAVQFGGAIHNGNGTVTIINSTFSGNIADRGGALYGANNSTTTIEFATFSGNRADDGGAIWNNGVTNTITLSKSILANSRDEANSFDQLECDGPSLTTAGYNIIQDDSCFSTGVEGDLRSTDPALGPLQNNGGFSLTHLPASASPAVDRVPVELCLPDDQRRAQRVNACDSGAAERGGLFPTVYVPIVLR